MTAKTERITVLAEPAFKDAVTAQAHAAGLSVSEWIRLRCEADDGLTPAQAAELAAMVHDLNAALDVSRRTLDALHARTDAARAEFESLRKQPRRSAVSRAEVAAMAALLGLDDDNRDEGAARVSV